MPYDHDTGRDLRRLLPLGAANLICTILVVAELARTDQRIVDDLGLSAVAYWFLIMPAQAVGSVALTLLLVTMAEYDVPVVLRLPTLVAVSAGLGAIAFWWGSPWMGAVCGTVTMAGWLVSIRDLLA